VTVHGGRAPLRVRLANGHLVVALPPRGGTGREWRVGEIVRVHLTPYDLSRGRLVSV
jgi:translation initiation factor IF-1